MKAKIYSVSVGVAKFLVYGTSRASAVNNLMEAMKKDTSAELASGEQVYNAALAGVKLVAGDKYKPDPVDERQEQLPLADSGEQEQLAA